MCADAIGLLWQALENKCGCGCFDCCRCALWRSLMPAQESCAVEAVCEYEIRGHYFSLSWMHQVRVRPSKCKQRLLIRLTIGSSLLGNNFIQRLTPFMQLLCDSINPVGFFSSHEKSLPCVLFNSKMFDCCLIALCYISTNFEKVCRGFSRHLIWITSHSSCQQGELSGWNLRAQSYHMVLTVTSDCRLYRPEVKKVQAGQCSGVQAISSSEEAYRHLCAP